MSELSITRLWLMRALFTALTLAVIFFSLLPLETTPRRWAGPDLVMAFGFAWVLRRPEYVPLPLIAVLLFLADLMLGRPPGLWAALALIAFENLRARAPRLRDMPFTVEWLTVAIAMASVMLGYRLLLAVFLVQDPSLGLLLMRLFATILVYPLAVVLTRFGFGLRKAQLGEVNALGQRQ
ncbi:rod shape-determining protein MreD [Marimonas lutisalis]|uniref:rod shape-determining protein MreD n=1 Tax=Marimonas lutisalis TaxID=2545756 RepID=UPI0010F7E7DD|nr:rod shape-determining protein MreD [Marimonas lutisalis]